jgi:hypothetical protein
VIVPLAERCECHDWRPREEIGGWRHGGVLVRDWARRSEIWKPRRCEMSREELRGLVITAGRIIRCEYALEATRYPGGHVELAHGVHRWTIADELGIDALPVRINDAADSPMSKPF